MRSWVFYSMPLKEIFSIFEEIVCQPETCLPRMFQICYIRFIFEVSFLISDHSICINTSSKRKPFTNEHNVAFNSRPLRWIDLQLPQCKRQKSVWRSRNGIAERSHFHFIDGELCEAIHGDAIIDHHCLNAKTEISLHEHRTISRVIITSNERTPSIRMSRKRKREIALL